MSQYTFITTPIYYTNGAPHIGHAYTTILADAMKKIEQMKGNTPLLSTGTDEHGQKNQHSCEKIGKPIDVFLEEQSALFKNLFNRLNIDYDFFVRTSAASHKTIVSRILQNLYDRGLIIKKNYEGLYCEGCEQFKKKCDLDENGLCPDHQVKPKVISEENYFFRLEPYRQWLKEYITNNPDWITPRNYAKEVLSMLEEPLEDLCISRPKSRVWLGIELPFDKNFVTYIWFDALINYISTLDWENNEKFEEIWKNSYHLLAKDILKPHCVYWPIMLKAIGIPPVHRCIVHGYWIGEGGIKMSKSLGNVVDPNEVIDSIGTDALRFYLLNNMNSTGDAPISISLLLQGYRILANGLGNLQMRALKILDKNLNGIIPAEVELTNDDKKLLQDISDSFKSIYAQDLSLSMVNELTNQITNACSLVNGYFSSEEPWILAKDPSKSNRFKQVLKTTLEALSLIATAAYPIMPKISKEVLNSLNIPTENIITDFNIEKLKSEKIKVPEPLFPPLEKKVLEN